MNAPTQTAHLLPEINQRATPQALIDADLSARLLLQVHDELVLESPDDQAERAAKIVKKTMEDVSIFDVPVVAEYGVGSNWDDAH